MNNRITKTMRAKAGFTLVELIVVIAILGILAGVGTVGYSGYIKKANMAADQQLVASIERAVAMEYAQSPANFGGVPFVILTTDGIKGYDSDDSIVKAAVENAFGAGMEDSLKLKYNGWPRGAAVTKEVISYFQGLTGDDNAVSVLFVPDAATGKVDSPSFSNDVDALFDRIKETAQKVAGATGGGDVKLVQNAAEITNDGTNASDFATKWATSVWSSDYLMGENSGKYTESDIENAKNDSAQENFMKMAVANAAVIMARNTSFATYFCQQNPQFADTYDGLSNYTMGSSGIPQDLCNSGEIERIFDKLIADGSLESSQRGAFIGAFNTVKRNYFAGADSQAYTDALAYYTMMTTVKNVNNTEEQSNEAYWEEMKTGVSLYGAIARGETTLTDLTSTFGALDEAADGVVVTFAVRDGQLYSANSITAG